MVSNDRLDNRGKRTKCVASQPWTPAACSLGTLGSLNLSGLRGVEI
jgi:hypothetical protein